MIISFDALLFLLIKETDVFKLEKLINAGQIEEVILQVCGFMLNLQ